MLCGGSGHQGATARSTALVHQFDAESGFDGNLRNEPAGWHAAQLSLFETGIGHVSLTQGYPGQENRKYDRSSGRVNSLKGARHGLSLSHLTAPSRIPV